MRNTVLQLIVINALLDVMQNFLKISLKFNMPISISNAYVLTRKFDNFLPTKKF